MSCANSRLVWPALTASPRTYSNSLEKRSKLVGSMFLSITSSEPSRHFGKFSDALAEVGPHIATSIRPITFAICVLSTKELFQATSVLGGPSYLAELMTLFHRAEWDSGQWHRFTPS